SIRPNGAAQLTGSNIMSRAAAVSPAQSGASAVLQPNQDEFRQYFGKLAFALPHKLADDPLFSLARLSKAAERCSGRFYMANGVTAHDARFSEMTSRRAIASALENLQTSNSWAKISNVGASDPAYLDVQHAVLKEVQELSGRPIL